MRSRLGLLGGAALPVRDQDPVAVPGRRPGQGAVGDQSAEIPDAVQVEARLLAGGVRRVDTGCLHGDECLPGDAQLGLVDGGGDGPFVTGTGGQREPPVGEFLSGHVVVGRHTGDRDGPTRAERQVDGHPAPGGSAQRGLHTVPPGSAAPAVVLGVQHGLVLDAVVDGGDLHAAEARVGDLVDLTGDLVRVHQTVGPPPAELGAHRARRIREPVGRRRVLHPRRPGRRRSLGPAARGGLGGCGHSGQRAQDRCPEPGDQRRTPGRSASSRRAFIHGAPQVRERFG